MSASDIEDINTKIGLYWRMLYYTNYCNNADVINVTKCLIYILYKHINIKIIKSYLKRLGVNK